MLTLVPLEHSVAHINSPPVPRPSTGGGRQLQVKGVQRRAPEDAARSRPPSFKVLGDPVVSARLQPYQCVPDTHDLSQRESSHLRPRMLALIRQIDESRLAPRLFAAVRFHVQIAAPSHQDFELTFAVVTPRTSSCASLADDLDRQRRDNGARD